MQITINSVSVSKPAGKKYNVAEVDYNVDGQQARFPFKIFDFSNPATFKALEKASPGDEFAITVAKNDKGYDNWTSATKVAAGSGVAPSPARSAPSKSSYETAEERAARQRLIVRQSSLAQAITFLGGQNSAGTSTNDVLELAEVFTDWVFEETTEEG